MASGIKKTLELLSGPKENIYAMDFYWNDNNFISMIDKLFSKIDGKQLIICTDLQYGSVNQLFVRKINEYPDENILLFTGINLPLLLELITISGEITKERADELALAASSQLLHFNSDEILKQIDDDNLF